MLERDAERLVELHSATERLGQMGSWEWRPGEGGVTWSENLFRIYGFEPGEVEPTIDLVMERTHPDDRGALEERLRSDGDTAAPGDTLEYRVVRPDGTIRWLRATTTMALREGEARVIGLVADLTDQRHAARELDAHLSVDRVLRDWVSVAKDGPRLLGSLGGALGLTRGVFWVPEGDVLRARALWQAPDTERSGLENEILGMSLANGVGFAGEAWKYRRPVVVANASAKFAYSFRAAASRDGLQGALAVPVLHGEEVLAVVGLAGPEVLGAGERLMNILTEIGHEIGDALSRHRGDLDPQLLTRRETEILQLVAESLSGPAIAERLGIAPSTVKTHLLRIYDKLEVDDRAAAVATGLRRGLIT
jgi:PAS domain S-box-containing protein